MSKKLTNGFLAKNIRFLREYAGMTQTIFAVTFGCTRSNVVSYEAGTVPKLDLLLEIVNYFGTTIETLYYNDLSETNEGFSKKEHFYPNLPNIEDETNEDEDSQKNKDKKNITFPIKDEENDPLKQPPKRPPISKRIELEGQKIKYQTPANLEDLIQVSILDTEAIEEITGAFDVQDLIMDESIYFPASYLEKAHEYVGFVMNDNSMSPTVYLSDTVIVSRVALKSIIDNRLYLVIDKGLEAKVRRVQNYLKSDGYISCIPDNKTFSKYNLFKDDIVGIFEVWGKLSFRLDDETFNLVALYNKLESKVDELDRRMKSYAKKGE